MARTRQEILDAFLADPQYAVLTSDVNGETVTLTEPERLARINEWADATLAAEQEADAQAALKELRRQVRLARTRLQQIRDASGTFTNAQRDAAIKDVARYLDGLIGVLIDLNLIERNDD